jgi:ligand-binding sensor domain-containing protein
VLCSIALAQQPKQYPFTHYSMESGLISNQVNTIIQDKQGYIWMGTTDGLQRYDGTRYKAFRHIDNDSSSIPSNPVWQLLLDKKGNLWLLMADGRVGIFNTHNFKFREVAAHFKKPVSPNTFIKQLKTDDSGNLFYLISGSEMITWNEKAGEFSSAYNFIKQNPEWDIVDFCQEPGTQKYWMSIANNGLAIYNKQTGQLSFTGNNEANEDLVEKYTNGNNWTHLFFDRSHRLWSVSFDKLPYINCYDVVNKKMVVDKAKFSTNLKSYYEVKGFVQQQDGTIWAHGLLVFAKFDEKEKQFQFVNNEYRNEHSIVYEMVHCLYEDRENNVWIGTDNNGLYRFNPAKDFFTNVSHINRMSGKKGEGRPMSFINTKWGTLLAGTWEDGLYHYDEQFNIIPHYVNGFGKETTHIWSMAASHDGNTIWMGSQPGIYMVNQANRSSRFYNPVVLQNKTVRQLAEDKNNDLWLGMQDLGVFKWIRAKGRNKFEDGLKRYTAIPELTVNKITIDSKGYVWIATPENGVYLIDSNTDSLLIHFHEKAPPESKLPEKGASSVLEYSDSIIIITTATRIVRYNRILKKISLIGNSGTLSGFITAIEKDKHGFLWLTTTAGLYRINLSKKIFVMYGKPDGLNNEHFVQSASFVMPDGRMLFGTTNDILIFDPAKINVSPVTDDARITDFILMNQPLPVDSILKLKNIDLDYKENSLKIEFSPMIYGKPYLIKYKLEGLDKNWIYAGKNNEAIYSYIPPGNYSFILKLMDEEGNETTKTTQLDIKVNKPFWETIWFYTILGLGGIYLLYRIERDRTKKKETIEKMRNEIADDLHDEVNTALGNINVLSEMANLKVRKDPEKSQEYIEQIHQRSRNMLVAMGDMLWIINPKNDSMSKVIDRIKEHIDALRNQHEVTTQLLVDDKVKKLKLDMRLRKNLFWLLKGGSTNLINSGADNCMISIFTQKQNFIYRLEFDTVNVDMQMLNNLLQRQELIKKIDEMKAKLKVQLDQPRGIIKLTIPV